jgi:hypothetical protein
VLKKPREATLTFNFLVEKYLKPFTSLENSKSMPSSQRLRFTGKSSRVHTVQTLAGNLACPAVRYFKGNISV